MKKIKVNIFLSVILLTGVILSACGAGNSQEAKVQSASQGEHNFKLTTIVGPTHSWTKTAEKFKEELETRSDGRMKLEIFPASQLGPEADMIQQMISGSVDFGFITTAYLASRNKELNAWLMPFLFEDISDANKMRDTESANQLLDLFSEQGLVGMDWLFTGSHSILMKSGVMDSPEEFKGKKIRAPGSEVINDFYNALGASPVPMPLPEVYQGLQTGVVDGVNASADSAYSQKFYEVGEDFTLLNQFAFNAAVLMSKVKFDSLSKNDQKIVEEAMKAAIDYGNELAIQETEENLELLKKEGLNIHKPSSLKAFKGVTEEIYKKYSEQSPLTKEFIEEATSS
ncbi:TRAP transporter substrate-binding protein [Bacillus sp. V3-13]|uniref:TRAP transporter substrate-binding protein n=1 Tax=Bacillus sp. V3-13 TaxID=2053728 RepID=UPI0015E0B422|nr:TRAP transporter substrate-binding protein [Bacillus sp. V3-13]